MANNEVQRKINIRRVPVSHSISEREAWKEKIASMEMQGFPTWADPIARPWSKATYKNLNHVDTDNVAVAHYLKQLPSQAFDGVLFQTPRKRTHQYAIEMKECKQEINRMIKNNGKVVCIRDNSCGMGKCYGYTLERIYLLPCDEDQEEYITVEFKSPEPDATKLYYDVDGDGMALSRQFCAANKHTFKIKPFREMLDRVVKPSQEQGNVWIDPFAGFNSIANVQNDINTEAPTQFHMDAKSFLEHLRDSGQKVDGVLFDPPYSTEQVKVSYHNNGKHLFTKEYLKQCRDLILELLRSGGMVLCFGWSSNEFRVPKKNIKQILICDHGAAHITSLCTVIHL